MLRVFGKATSPTEEATLRQVLQKAVPAEDAKGVLADGNIDSDEAVRILGAPTAAQAPQLGSMVDILLKHGSKNRAILAEAGTYYAKQANVPSTDHAERVGLLEAAEKWIQAAIDIEPEATDRLAERCHFNLGQIYFLQSKSERDAVPQLAKAEAEFSRVMEMNPKDVLAQSRREACAAARRGQPLVTHVREVRDQLMGDKELPPGSVTDSLLSEVIIGAVLESAKRDEVPRRINDFLQSAIDYRPDRTDDDEYKTPAQLFRDRWGDCDDWANFAHLAFDRAGIDNTVIMLPVIKQDLQHIAVIYRLGPDDYYFVIDNEGITPLTAADPQAALQEYYAIINPGSSPSDLKGIGKYLLVREGDRGLRLVPAKSP